MKFIHEEIQFAHELYGANLLMNYMKLPSVEQLFLSGLHGIFNIWLI